MKSDKKGSGRRHETTSLAVLLADAELAEGLTPRLAAARRLYRMVIGPTVASESDPVALIGTVITVAARTRETIRTIQEQERFLLRTWKERLEAPPITRIRYEVRAGAYETVQPKQLPAASDEKPLEPSEEVRRMAACIKDTKLRDSMAQWMAVLEARTEKNK